MAKLGEVCDILNGYAFKSNQYTTSGVRIIRISNVQKGNIEGKSPVYYPCDDENVKKYELKQNDLLISLTGNVGRTALLEEKFLPAALNQRVSCIRLKEPDKVLKTYLFHLLNSDYFEQQCMKAAEGVAKKNLSPKWLFEYKIPIYSIERQKEISNTLDKIDLLIILRKQQLAKLDELVKAQFVEMFGDFEFNPKEFPVYQLCELCDVGSSKRIYQEEQSISGIPCLKVADVNELIDTGKHPFSTFIPLEPYEQLLRKELTPTENDILITSRGTLGKCYIVQSDDEFYFQDGMISWLSNFSPKVSSIYISYLFAQPYIQKQIESLQAGSTVAYLSIAMLKKINVILPPKKLQDDFATFVEHVDQQKQTVQQSLEKLKLMKKALMQEYFG